ncbi:hypothetical protein [Ensifer canadensis]
MRKLLMIALNCIWVFSIMISGTAFGALHGWEQHGLVGAIALGFVAFVASAFIASAPSSLIGLLA